MGESVVSVALADEPATEALAASLVDALPEDWSGLVFGLRGELGAGKSTLARAMLRTLGHEGTVPSPTYTLIEPYALSGGSVYHIDLYRIVDGGELEFLGLDDLDDGLRLIEWPERAPDVRRAADLDVAIRYEGGGRHAEIAGQTPRGTAVVDRLRARAAALLEIK